MSHTAHAIYTANSGLVHNQSPIPLPDAEGLPLKVGWGTWRFALRNLLWIDIFGFWSLILEHLTSQRDPRSIITVRSTEGQHLRWRGRAAVRPEGAPGPSASRVHPAPDRLWEGQEVPSGDWPQWLTVCLLGALPGMQCTQICSLHLHFYMN